MKIQISIITIDPTWNVLNKEHIEEAFAHSNILVLFLYSYLLQYSRQYSLAVYVSFYNWDWGSQIIITNIVLEHIAGLVGSVGCTSDWWSGGNRLDPHLVGNILSWRFDHEIFSTVILSLPLIQEGQLSISGQRKCTMLVNLLED